MAVPGVDEEFDEPGDLGRRLVERREELGVSRDEVARRAGTDPGYLGYLESRADARPGAATMTRLAAALETSAADLGGAGIGKPSGAGQVPEGSVSLVVLLPDACLEYLAGGGVGRVVFDAGHGPVALPINFGMLDGDIVFHTGEGTILAAVRAKQQMSVEVDHIDEARGEGWSVLATGPCEEVADPAFQHRVELLGVDPWAGGDRRVAVCLHISDLSGRRIRRHPQ